MERIFKHNYCGQEMTVTVGKFAEQANGESIIRCGDTILLATATASKQPREGIDFFPLSCDFEEKQYSVGKIPGGFIKREGRPTERAILSSRLIDRPLRPLFPDGYRNDVQIVATAFSVDEDHAPDVLGIVGASIALTLSDIPFDGPIGAVTVAYVDDEYIFYPNKEQRDRSKLHLTVAGSAEAIMMVESGASELTEEQMLQAILKAHEEIKSLCAFIEDIRTQIGKPKMKVEKLAIPEALENDVRAFVGDRMSAAVRDEDKIERILTTDALKKEVKTHFEEKYPEEGKLVSFVLDTMEKEAVRHLILNERTRPDNRAMDQIRKLDCEVAYLPRAHGSGIFRRGQTQVLSVATLGAPGDAQSLDGIMDNEDKRYIHHYNFPPYSVGDTRPMRGPGRREIGHGALAERALLPVLPPQEDFPYTMRVVSEVLSSNGSSSQASVCGSTLALMDAGVPIKAPVAGIAMGLVADGDNVAILTDIQGLEDHLGDMDFKVAGTREGITAMQMDIKIKGISEEILREALEKARIARLTILDAMENELASPRKELSPYAPRIFTITVHPEKIREVIGPGGKVINGIIAETGVKIDTYDDGSIVVTGQDGPSGEKAIAMIEEIVKEVEVGEVYNGRVTRLMNFGAFLEVLPGKEGLLHISNISHERVEKIEDAVKVGDEMLVKVSEIDSQGRINLNRKVLLPRPEGMKEVPERKDRGPRDQSRRRGGNDYRGKDRGPRGPQKN